MHVSFSDLSSYSPPDLRDSKLDRLAGLLHTKGCLKTTRASRGLLLQRFSKYLTISRSRFSLVLLKSSFPALLLAEVHSTRLESVAPIISSSFTRAAQQASQCKSSRIRLFSAPEITMTTNHVTSRAHIITARAQSGKLGAGKMKTVNCKVHVHPLSLNAA